MLNIAAALLEGDSKVSKTSWVRGALGVTGALFIASSAPALEGIDLSRATAAPTEGECPALIKIKYPFLSCVNGQIGLSDADETWENSRRIPRQGDWNEGNGTWGPAYGSDD